MRKLLRLALLTVLLTPLAAHAFEVGVRGAYWFPNMEADARIAGGGFEGTKLDLADDLGMDDESFPGVEAFLGLGDHHLSLSALRAAYEGQANVGAVEFNGQTFADDVESEFNFTMVDFAYRYDLLNLENLLAGFSVGPVLQVKYLSGDVWMKETASGQTEEKDFTAVVPMIGAAAHIGILADWIEARAQVAGIGYAGNRLVDGLAEIVITPFPLLDIGAGYRYLKLALDQDDAEVNVSLAGPYATLSISW